MSAPTPRAGTGTTEQDAQMRVRNAWIVTGDGVVSERSYPLDWSARVRTLEGIRDGLKRSQR